MTGVTSNPEDASESIAFSVHMGSRLLEPIRGHLARHGPRGLAVDVVGAALGDDAGLVGAAGWRKAFTPDAALPSPLP